MSVTRSGLNPLQQWVKMTPSFFARTAKGPRVACMVVEQTARADSRLLPAQPHDIVYITQADSLDAAIISQPLSGQADRGTAQATFNPHIIFVAGQLASALAYQFTG